MNSVKLVVNDDNSGLGAARKQFFGQYSLVTMQFSLATHCPEILRENAGAFFSYQVMKADLSSVIRVMFNTQDRKTAELFLQAAIQKYANSLASLSTWMEEKLAEEVKVFDFPLEHRRSIRTTNSLERINKEIRRRTRELGVFPKEASCLRLIYAILIQISEEWQIGKSYCVSKS